MPSLGGNMPIKQCLSEMAQAGFAGTEMGTKYPRDPDVLGPLLGDYGLALASGWYSASLLERSAEQEIEAMQAHLLLLKAMNAEVMVVGEVSNTVHGDIDVPLSQRPQLADEEWEELGEKLTICAEYLAGENVQLAYHHHVGTVVETAEDIDRLMRSTGVSVGLTLDTGHLAFAGANPIRIMRQYSERIAHVHLKDIRAHVLTQARQYDWPFLKAVMAGVFTVPGDGCIDFAVVFRQLAATDYTGWLLVEAEQDPGKADPLTYARLAYENVNAYARQARL